MKRNLQKKKIKECYYFSLKLFKISPFETIITRLNKIKDLFLTKRESLENPNSVISFLSEVLVWFLVLILIMMNPIEKVMLKKQVAPIQYVLIQL